jgi:UDP-N-acetyl-2-amino-2-deoxyglucuronate dehydrogenase
LLPEFGRVRGHLKDIDVAMNFAIVGAAGFVAPRHLQAIRDSGHIIAAATDPSDSVGVLDRFSLRVRYFREIERFERHLDRRRRGPEADRIHYISVCSPNYLHDAHVRMALRNGAHAICEKPLVINPWNLDALAELERETGFRVFTVLQLRVHPALLALKQRLESDPGRSKHDVTITYVTSRGPWYHQSWKGAEDRSGGITMNIGIHLFDLVLWLFGPVQRSEVHVREETRAAGFLELDRANVRWFLSLDSRDLPQGLGDVASTHRSVTVDGQHLELTDGFNDLHTRVYEQTLQGNGVGIEDARPSIELVSRIRSGPVVVPTGVAHRRVALR